jgi:hypothetical protein
MTCSLPFSSMTRCESAALLRALSCSPKERGPSSPHPVPSTLPSLSLQYGGTHDTRPAALKPRPFLHACPPQGVCRGSLAPALFATSSPVRFCSTLLSLDLAPQPVTQRRNTTKKQAKPDERGIRTHRCTDGPLQPFPSSCRFGQSLLLSTKQGQQNQFDEAHWQRKPNSCDVVFVRVGF